MTSIPTALRHYNHTYVTKSLLPKAWRVSSPESECGVTLLTPVTSPRAFSSHHTTESPGGSQHPEGDPFSSISGDTSSSSTSASDHDTEDSPCCHQATEKALQEKDDDKYPKSLRTSSSFVVQRGKIKQKFADLGIFRSKLENWKSKPSSAAQASTRSPCMPFSWFNESRKGSYSFRNLPSAPSPLQPSPETQVSDKTGSKNFTFNDDFSPSSTSSADLSGLGAEPKTPGLSQSLALSSDEVL